MLRRLLWAGLLLLVAFSSAADDARSAAVVIAYSSGRWYPDDEARWAQLRVSADGRLALAQSAGEQAVAAKVDRDVAEEFVRQATSQEMLAELAAVASLFPPQGEHCPTITVASGGTTFSFTPNVRVSRYPEGLLGTYAWEYEYPLVGDLVLRAHELSAAGLPPTQYTVGFVIFSTHIQRLSQYGCGNP